MQRFRTLFVLMAGLLILIAGCQGRVSTIEPTATSIEYATAQAVQATQLAMPPTHTPTEIPPTWTPLPTNTPLPSDTPRPTDTPSPTATETPNFAATAQEEASRLTQTAESLQATLDAALLATREAQPTDTPYPTYTREPSATPTETVEPTAAPTLDQASTQVAEQTLQAEFAAQVAEAAAATLAAYTPAPTQTSLPTYTPFPTPTAFPTVTLTELPEPTLTATITPQPTPAPTRDRRGTQAALSQERATEAADIQAALAATVDAYTAVPTYTLYPTYTIEPSPTATATPEPTLTATLDTRATREAEQTQQAEFAAQVEAAAAATIVAFTAEPTQTPLPTYTPYPTFTTTPSLTATDTPEPTRTATATPEPTLTATVDIRATREAEQTQRAEFAAQIEAAAAATIVAFTAEPTQTPLPTYTPYPTYTMLPSVVPSATETPEPTPTATVAASPTEPPTLTPSPTSTPAPPTATRTPAPPTETRVPPTQAITLEPSPVGPTPDLFASATAQMTQPTATMPLAPAQVTATAIISDATSTAAAVFAATAENTKTPTQFPYEATGTAIAIAPLRTPTVVPTVDFGATATQIIMNATASAESILAADRLTISLPETWEEAGIGPNLRYYTDGTAHLYTYSGDRAYFARQWGIPAEVTDLSEATAALADYALGTVTESDLDNVGQVAVEAAGDFDGLLYLISREDTWVILSVSAPADRFEMYRVEVFDPAVLSVQISEPGTLPATLTPLPTSTVVQVTVTATAANPMMMTQTQVLLDLTMTATSYVTPLPSLARTLVPSATPRPSATVTPSPVFGATATALIAQATASAVAIQAPPASTSLDVPDNWEAPVQVNKNTQYLTDSTARIFVYQGDEAYFAKQWDIPESASTISDAAEALAAHVGGAVDESPLAHAVPVRLPVRDGTQGVIYLVSSEPWIIVSASAPAEEFDRYQAEVFDPLVQSLGSADMVEVTPVSIVPTATRVTPTPIEATATRRPVRPTTTPVPLETSTTPTAVAPTGTQAPLTFEPYANKAIGLALDIPAGWVQYTDPSLTIPEMGVMAVFLFSNPAEAGSIDEAPTEPALFLLRIASSSSNFLGVENIETPEDLLIEAFELERAQVKTYTLNDYPAARALIDGEAQSNEDGIIYALDLGKDGWLIAGLVVPAGYNVLLLDETIMMPVLRSIQVIGPVSPDASDAEDVPAAEKTPTSVPAAVTASPAPTLTPRP